MRGSSRACNRLAGLGLLALGTQLYALTDAPASRRTVHWIALALITLVSFLFGAMPAIGGLLQRLLWVLAGVSRDGRDSETF